MTVASEDYLNLLQVLQNTRTLGKKKKSVVYHYLGVSYSLLAHHSLGYPQMFDFKVYCILLYVNVCIYI